MKSPILKSFNKFILLLIIVIFSSSLILGNAFNLPTAWVLTPNGTSIDANNNGWPDYADNVLNSTFAGTANDANRLGGQLPAYYLNYDNMNAGTIADAFIQSSANWNLAFGWGDHSVAGYLVAADLINYYTKTQTYNKSEVYNKSEIDNLPVSTFSNDAGYLTAVDENDPFYFSNPNNYYNSSDFNVSDYYNITQVDSLPISTFTNDAGYLTSFTETDPVWISEKNAYSTTAEILAFGYYNASDFVITDYFTSAEILAFNYYNASDFDINDYFTSAEILAFNYYNSSDFDINDYLTGTEILSYNYYNSSDFNITDYLTTSEILSYNYYNGSDFNISDYVLTSTLAAYNYYNASDFDINDYVTALTLSGYNYYNASDFDINDYLTSTEILSYNYYNASDFDIKDYYTKTEVYNKTESDDRYPQFLTSTTGRLVEACSLDGTCINSTGLQTAIVNTITYGNTGQYAKSNGLFGLVYVDTIPVTDITGLTNINISTFINDAGYLTNYTETDPFYFNNPYGYYNSTTIPIVDNSNFYNKTETYNISETYNKTQIDNLNVSHFNNDAGYLTTESDPFYFSNPNNYYNSTTIPDINLSNYYNKTEINNNLSNYLPLTGGTMSGDINMSVNNLYDVDYLFFQRGAGIFDDSDEIWLQAPDHTISQRMGNRKVQFGGDLYADNIYQNDNAVLDNTTGYTRELANATFLMDESDPFYFSNPNGYYNSSNFNISDYVLYSTLSGYNYYNSSDFNISDYYTQTQVNNLPISTFSNDVGYITDYNVTSQDVTQHQADINITESQITDLQAYLLTETDPFYFSNPNSYYNSSDFNIANYYNKTEVYNISETYNKTQTDARYVFRDGDDLSAIFNYTNSTIRLDANTNLFFYDTGDEAKHLNSFAENYDRLRVNTFTTPLVIDTFNNATGTYINISSESGQNIGVILYSGDYVESYRFSYNNTILQLTEGTDDVPITNYVYVYNNAGTPEWQVSVTEPIIQNAHVATVNVGAAGYIYWADLQEEGEDEFLQRVQSVNKKRGLLYVSGLDYNATSTILEVSSGDYINGIYDSFTSYINSSGNGIYTILFNGSYAKYSSFADLMSNGEYSDGTEFGSNKYVNIIFGVTPYDGESRLYAVIQNQPNTEYTSVNIAFSDPENKLNVYPSDEETRLRFLPVARMILNTNSGLAQIITNTSYAIDYRGGVAGGVSSGGGLTEIDPVFSASDVADITDADQANWDTAYGWGDHATEGYLKNESDPFYFSNPNGYYNSSYFSIDDYVLATTLASYNYYNSSDFSISDYYTKTQINNNFSNYYTQTEVNNLPVSTFSNDAGYTDYDTTNFTTDFNSKLAGNIAIGGNLTIEGGYAVGGTTFNSGSAWITNDLFIGGDFVIVDAARINGSVLVDNDNVYSIGNSTHRFSDVWAYTLHGNITESQITDLQDYLLTESDPFYFSNPNGYYNSSDFSINDYVLATTLAGYNYYNASDFSISDYYTKTQIDNFNYYNSSDFNINDYVLSTTLAGYNYYNASDFSISDYYTKTQINNNFSNYYTQTEVDNLPISTFSNDAGYLTSYTETDPVFSASHASDITITNTSNWNTAYGWGDHATEGYLTSYTETDPVWTSEKVNYYNSSQVDALPVSTFSNDAGYSTTVGTVTSVTAGAGMTQSGTSTINPTLDIVSHVGSAGSIGTINVDADAIGVDLGTTSTTAYRGDLGNTAYNDRLKWDGGSTGLIASTGRTSLGATNVGSNLFTLTNPSAIRFLRINADNTVSALSDSDFRTAIGAGTSSTTGTVTSVAVSGSDGLEIDSGSPITTSGTIALGVNKANLLSHINVEDGADVTDATNVNAAGAVMESDYNANTMLLATTDNTPVASTATQIRTFLNVADGATANTGTVTSVAAGNGMDFTSITGTGSVTMGTPSSLTASTTNAVTTTSHTHEITGFVEGTTKITVSATEPSSPSTGDIWVDSS